MIKKRKSSNLRFHKSGNAVIDTIMVIIVIVVLGIVSMITYKAFGDIKPDILAEMNSAEAQDTLNESYDRFPSTLDNIFLLAFFLLWGLVIVASFMIDSHPIFFIITFILLVFVIIAGVMLGNFYEELFQDSDLAEMPASFPATNWILTHMLAIGIVVAFSIAIVLFGKNKFS